MDEHGRSGSVRLRLLADAVHVSSLEELEYPGSPEVARVELETLLREGRVELNDFEKDGALALDEALAAVADETSWAPDGRGDEELFLRVTKSGYEEYARTYPPTMFDPAAVVAVFEEATSVRLERERYPELDRLRLTNPVIRQLPQVENYSSPETPNERLGGHFTVRLYLDGDWLDEGLRDNTGLERVLPERGPQEYYVTASARRANVELMFWGDTSEITPEAETTWALLTECLRRL